ncbi:hypothetical protein SAMN05192583_0067 [Sphingomonas gellani]|uniref:Fibronectin type-III domain-containing protein n=1 Tax=Sphingomonas gellani TaxID=1166340 RepID=A0A1H7Y3B5_9SPHN|nr:hypothetical protein [Sphingomonas gellani]SEM40415.1 hypothetical protein SAMN05192583_0067 [Sphingomonas gellani]
MAKVLKTVAVIAIAVAVVVFAPQIAGVLASVAGPLGVTVATAAISSALIGMGLTMALTAAASMFRKAPSMSQSLVDRLNTSVVPTAARKIVFGTTAAGQDVRFFEGDIDLPSTKKDGYVQVIALASHRINALRSFYTENDLVWQDGSFVSKRDGFAPNNPFRVVTEGKPGNGFSVGSGRYWNSASTFTGCAYYVPFWKLDEKVWESGVPQRLTAIVEGCPLYDPRRDSTRGGSGSHRASDQATYVFRDGSVELGRNPALALLTYLLGWRINGKLVWGMGIPAHRIDFDNFRTYANLCEERVATQAGSTVQRYTVDGIFSTADSHETVINGITATMGSCKLTDRGGTYCLVGGYDDTAGPKISFTADDLVAPANGSSPYVWNPAPPSRERYNIVRGRYAKPEELYQLADWGDPIEQPPLADGIPRTLSLDLGAVSRAETCQRIAKQFLLREYLCPGMFSATFGPKAFAVEIGSVITLSLPAEGWNNKLFRVMEQAETHDLFFQMTLREEDPAIYAWDREEKPLPASIRPQGYDASTTISPSGLTLTSDSYSGANAVNVSEVHVNWTPELSGRVSGIQIQSRPQGTDAWTEQAALFDPKLGMFTFTSNAPGITVEVQARFRMSSAVYSPWVMASVKTAEVITVTDWKNVTDTDGKRPQDNATVGAQLGNNLTNENGNALGRDEVLNASGAYSATVTYGFDDNTVQGFTGYTANLSVSNGVLSVTATSNDPILSIALSQPGKSISVIRARVRSTAAKPSWQGQVYYGTSSHSDSEGYTKRIVNPGFVQNEWRIVEWDMNSLTAGGTDYINNTITRLRFDLGQTNGETWEVDWVQLGARLNATYGAPAGSSVGSVAVNDLVAKLGTLDASGFTDTTAPAVPTGLALSSTLSDAGVTFNAAWNAVSATDLAGYIIAIREGSGNYVEFTTTSASYSRTALARNTNYTAKVAAFDKAGNRSGFSAEVAITTAKDTIAPGLATAVSAKDITYAGATIEFTAPADNDLAGARVRLLLNGTVISDSNVNLTANRVSRVQLSGLTKATAYSVTVSTYDTSGNSSAETAAISFTTAGGIVVSDFAPNVSPIQTVTSLPTPSTWTGGSVVMFGGELYRLSNGAWTKAVGYSDVSGKPTSLSGINSTEAAKLSGIKEGAGSIADTRDANELPSYYYAKGRGEYQEFKSSSFAASGSSGYGHLVTVVQWGDTSGGPVKQTLTDSLNNIYERYAITMSGWSAWGKNFNSSSKPKLGGDILDSAGATLKDSDVRNNSDGNIRQPDGGIYQTTDSSKTGALKITLPQGFINTMMKFTVDIYEYQQGLSCTLDIAGYTYSTNTWYNVSAKVVGGSNVEYPVRFGMTTDGKAAIWIGEANESWSYPQVRVRDFLGGYSGYSRANYEKGWSISFDTAAPTNVTQTVLDTYPAADWRKVTGTGRPADNAGTSVTFYDAQSGFKTLGNSITKSAFNNSWQVNIWTRESYTGSAIVSGEFVGGDTFIGLSYNGQNIDSYGQLEYSAYQRGDGQVDIYESGARIAGPFAGGAGVYSIAYDGVNVRYLKNGVAFYTSTSLPLAGWTMYAGFNAYAVGNGVKNIQFLPYMDNSLSNTDPAKQINRNTTTIDGGKLTTGTVDAIKLVAKSIGTAQLAASSVTANEILAGTIGAAQIAAGAIGATKLAVGNTDNVCADPFFRDVKYWRNIGVYTGDLSPGSGGGGWYQESTDYQPAMNEVGSSQSICLWSGSTAAPGAARQHAWTNRINSIKGGTNYSLSVDCFNASNQGINLYARCYNSDGGISGDAALGFPAQSGLTRGTTSFTTGPNVVGVEFIVFNNADSTYNGYARVSGLRLLQQAGATSIENGAVTTDKLTAEAVTADKIKGGTITGDKFNTATSLPGTITVGQSGVSIATLNGNLDLKPYGTLRPAEFAITGSSVARIAGGENWSSAYYSAEAFTGGASISGRLVTPRTTFGLGVPGSAGSNADDWNYGVAFRVHWSGDGGWYVGEDGSWISIGSSQAGVSFSASTVWAITYDGRYVRWYADSKLFRTTATTANRPFQARVLAGLAGARVTNLDFTSYADNSLSQTDPAARINEAATTINPGRILIQGGTTLDSWRDSTEIKGSAIKTGSITANKLTLNNRIDGTIGLNFEWNPTNNWIYWDQGYIYWFDDNNNRVVTYINQGNTGGAGAHQFFYWFPGQNNISFGQVDPGLPDRVHIGSWWGGSNLNIHYGGTIMNGNRITTGTVTADKMNVGSLSAISGNIGTVTAGLVRSTSGKAYFDLDNARIVFNNGSVMKVQGVGFGSSNQFIEWFGPVQNSFSNCSESNATYYLKTDGSAYFGGSLSAGVLKNSVQTTATAGNASVTTGTFGSNGRSRVVTVGYSFNGNTRITGGCPTPYTPYATVRLYRGTDANGTLLAEQRINGSNSCSPGAGQYEPGSNSDNIGGSFTYTDNTGGSQSAYYVVLVDRYIGTNIQGQSLGVTSVEQ